MTLWYLIKLDLETRTHEKQNISSRFYVRLAIQLVTFENKSGQTDYLTELFLMKFRLLVAFFHKKRTSEGGIVKKPE